MPPTFVYILALAAYFSVACTVWVVALVLSLFQRTRAIAKQLAAGMAVSFPGVFLFQLVSAPLILFALLLVAGIARLVYPDPENTVFSLLIAFFVLSLLAFEAAVSLAGFYVGWRIGWEFAAGRSVRVFLNTDKITSPLVLFLKRYFSRLGKML